MTTITFHGIDFESTDFYDDFAAVQTYEVEGVTLPMWVAVHYAAVLDVTAIIGYRAATEAARDLAEGYRDDAQVAAAAAEAARDLAEGYRDECLVLSLPPVQVPTITSPSDGATGVMETPTITTSAPSFLYSGQVAGGLRIRVYESGTDTLVHDSGWVTGPTEYTPPAEVLSVSTDYDITPQHRDDEHTESAEGARITITTAATFVPAPTPTSPADGATDIGETPTLTIGAYDGPNTQIAAQWRVATSEAGLETAPIHDTGSDAVNLTTYTLPADVLSDGETLHYWQVRWEDSVSGWGAWAAAQSFTTVASFWDPYDPANIGQPRGGGFFGGVMHPSGESAYELIVAPKSAETTTQWKGANTATAGTSSYHDGSANTASMNNSSHPAAQHCAGGSWGGMSDWYLPARDEMELLYRNLKPSTVSNQTGGRTESGDHGENANSSPTGSAYTTSVPGQTGTTAFRSGGAEALVSDGTYYWSSTEYAPYTSNAWVQRWADGSQDNGVKNDSRLVRPVRRLMI